MAGRVRDTLVARDVLFGVALGLVWSLVLQRCLPILCAAWHRPGLAQPGPSRRRSPDARPMAVKRCAIIWGTLEFFFAAFLLRALLRNKWLAAAAFVVIFATLQSLHTSHPKILAPMWVMIFSIVAYAVTRFGLITLAVAIFTVNLLTG